MDYKNFFDRFLVSSLVLISYVLLNFYFQFLIYYLVIFLYLIILIEVVLNFKKKIIIIISYLVISLIFFNFSILNNNNVFKNFNLLILIIISFDTFSYLFGSYLGRLKILKYLSPNKTLEGLIGGILSTYILSFFYILYFDYDLNYLIFLFINLLIISCFVGDLIESYFKRINNLKNSSNILPGHGGLFDRFDSFIFSIMIFTSIYNYIL